MISRLLDALTLGPRRRRRRLDRQLAHLDRIDEIPFTGLHVQGRRTPTTSRRRSEGGTRGRNFLIGAVAISLASWWALTQLGWQVGLDGIERPGSQDGSFVFTRTQPLIDSVPVAYSPCRQIKVVINAEQAPNDVDGLVEEAVERVADLTGLDLVVEGETDERPSEGVRSEGEPVLIAWTSPEEVPRLKGNVAGVGGSTSVRSGSGARTERYVSGQISLDAPQLGDILNRRNGRDQVRAVVLHELGHVVGLDHVDDRRQLMYAENVGVTDFAEGDRQGLKLLGQGSC